MNGYEKKGFAKFRETKEAKPVGMALALLIAAALVWIGFVRMLDGLVVAVLMYIIMRLFRVRDIRLLLTTAVLLLIILTAEVYTIFDELLSRGLTFSKADPTVSDIAMFVLVTYTLPFLLLSLLTWWMRTNLEKTRARLEAEGRLYPQGYGRCKRCGSLVLPGEIMCRKCGEYIDVPEEMRVKKVNYFECSECGREVPQDAGVCPFCGEVFEDEEPKQSS